MSMSPEEKLKSAMLKVPVLKTAILKFKFKKLLERLKKAMKPVLKGHLMK